ncbi:MAG: hypothetical protein AAB309_03445 [Deltaproteobacteria bacterium]
MKKNTKIKSVSFNNRKKLLDVTYTSGHKVSIHYSSLGIRKNLNDAWIDPESGKRSIGLELSDGSVDYMPYDQPLAIVKDPNFLLQSHIEALIATIKLIIKRKRISKRYLAHQLNTSDNQIQRLLNPAILNKNLKQLYAIANLLDLDLKIDAEDREAA